MTNTAIHQPDGIRSSMISNCNNTKSAHELRRWAFTYREVYLSPNRRAVCEEEDRGSRRPSRQIDRKAFEVTKRAISQRRLMGGAQDDTRRMMSLEGFLPALRA